MWVAIGEFGSRVFDAHNGLGRSWIFDAHDDWSRFRRLDERVVIFKVLSDNRRSFNKLLSDDWRSWKRSLSDDWRSCKSSLSDDWRRRNNYRFLHRDRY